MKKYKWVIILLNLVILIVFFNHSVIQKEKLLSEGKLLLLELAPVDPRSIMQGDFMLLRYRISDEIDTDTISKRGFFVVKTDSVKVAKRLRVQNGLVPLAEEETLIEYTTPGKFNINIGAESYFFEEGQRTKYAKARYGGLKVDRKGNSLLIGLYDENRQRIE